MKLIRTTGRNAREAAKTLDALERRGGAALDAVLPVVKRIVADVRKGGDRTLLRYAAKFDGLAGPNAMRVTKEEMAAAWKALDQLCAMRSPRLPRRFAHLLSGKCRDHGANRASKA